MAEIEGHLDLVIGHVPEGCDPVGATGHVIRIVADGLDLDVLLRVADCQAQRKSHTASDPTATTNAAITRRLDVCGASPAQLAESACTAAPLGV